MTVTQYLLKRLFPLCLLLPCLGSFIYAGKPFTALVVETEYDPLLVSPETTIRHTAVRSDGSIYLKHTWPDGRTSGNIFDRSLQRRIRFYPQAQAKVSYKLKPDQRGPRMQCTLEMLEAPEVGEVLGYRVVEYLVERDGLEIKM